MMKMCSRCKVNIAVVFMTRIEGDKTIEEGLCIKCAQQLGIKQVTDMIEKMGMTEDDVDALAAEATSLISSEENDEGEGRAPALNLPSLFSEKNGLSSNNERQSDKKQDIRREKLKRKNLDTFCIDLTAKAAEGKVDNIVGRKRELERVMQILCRRQKNNPCLIGEPGVGKTAIAEALAQAICNKEVPFALKNKEVLLVDMTAVVAGTQFRGQFENRMKGIIEEAKKLGNIILVIDEVHSIVSAGDAEGGMNAANILKPALSRGEIQIIGATTLTEYRKHIEKDSALERRFQPVIINEPSIEESVKILMGIKKYYEFHHGIKIPDYIVRKMVTVSERYITDRFLPDKAIDLMDEASASVAMNSPVINELSELAETLEKLEKRKNELEGITDEEEEVERAEARYKEIADIKTSELKYRERFDELSKKRDEICITEDDIAQVIEVWTGISAGSITENEFSKLDRLEEEIKKRIIGQDEAIAKAVSAIKRNRAGISYKKKPVSFIFAGSTGIGKTELVKVLANLLFDSPEALIRLDMSEYMEKHSVSRIIGSPPGYVGYDDSGQLTEKIRRKPYSVVLFDEIEKAHPDVLNILLQILDDGKITDAHGKEINFENTILIMTTNAGSNSEAMAGFSATGFKSDNEKVKKALSEFLRPEFLNRVDAVIVFNRLSKENIEKICVIMLDDLKSVLADKGITLVCDDKATDYLANKGYSDKYGARELRRLIQTEIEDPVADKIIGNYANPIHDIAV